MFARTRQENAISLQKCSVTQVMPTASVAIYRTCALCCHTFHAHRATFVAISCIPALSGLLLFLLIVLPHSRHHFCRYLLYFRTLGTTFVAIYRTSAPSGPVLSLFLVFLHHQDQLFSLFIVLPRETVGFLPFERFLCHFRGIGGHLSTKKMVNVG